MGAFATVWKGQLSFPSGHMEKAGIGLAALVISVMEVLIRTPTLRFDVLSLDKDVLFLIAVR